jgi:hypothetical protein
MAHNSKKSEFYGVLLLNLLLEMQFLCIGIMHCSFRTSVADPDSVSGLPDPDPLFRGMDQDPNPAPDPDLSIIRQK